MGICLKAKPDTCGISWPKKLSVNCERKQTKQLIIETDIDKGKKWTLIQIEAPLGCSNFFLWKSNQTCSKSSYWIFQSLCFECLEILHFEYLVWQDLNDFFYWKQLFVWIQVHLVVKTNRVMLVFVSFSLDWTSLNSLFGCDLIKWQMSSGLDTS